MTKLSLLAVDPDLQSARTLSEAFSRADFEFRAVPDLRRALAVLRGCRFVVPQDVYDVAARTSRRLLDAHPSVRTEDYRIQAPGRDMTLLGLYTLRIGIDTIALDRRGEWLYYGPVTGVTLWRVRVADLNDVVSGMSVDVSGLGIHVDDHEPGHLIMTGALHAAVPMTPGDVFRADFDRLGPITVRVGD